MQIYASFYMVRRLASRLNGKTQTALENKMLNSKFELRSHKEPQGRRKTHNNIHNVYH
jgi:hypothetical protein